MMRQLLPGRNESCRTRTGRRTRTQVDRSMHTDRRIVYTGNNIRPSLYIRIKALHRRTPGTAVINYIVPERK